MLLDPTDTSLAWLVVRTKPKQESLAAQVLGGREIEAYCPKVIEPRWHARSPKGPVPLFPSYVFARCEVRERFAAVHYCPGVAGVVRFGGRVAAVEDSFIEYLRAREGERGYLVMGEVRHHPVRGSRVRIVDGPFAGLEGIVDRYMPARDRVRLLLAAVRGIRNIEVEASHIRCA